MFVNPPIYIDYLQFSERNDTADFLILLQKALPFVALFSASREDLTNGCFTIRR